jgi:hypothetical protein
MLLLLLLLILLLLLLLPLLLLHPYCASTAQIGPWPPPLKFLNHSEFYTKYDYSGRVISPSQRPLTVQENTKCKHRRQTSMLQAGFQTVIPATKRLQTYTLDQSHWATAQHTILLNFLFMICIWFT